MEIIKARELLNNMRSIDSSNIREVVMKAYNDKKLADKVENDYLLKEATIKAGN